MIKLGLAVVVFAAIGCGSDGDSNELGRASVSGTVMGESISAGAIAWHATIADSSSSLIAVHETGVACDPDISAGNTLVLQFGCTLESGTFTIAADGSGNCPDQILALLENDGEDLAFASGGSVSLNEGDSLEGSFDIDFGDESMSGSFNLRDCGEITLE